MATSCPEEPSLATATAPHAANSSSALVSQVAQPVPLDGSHFLSFTFSKLLSWPPSPFAFLSYPTLAKGGLTLALWRAPGMDP